MVMTASLEVWRRVPCGGELQLCGGRRVTYQRVVVSVGGAIHVEVSWMGAQTGVNNEADW